MRTTLRHTLAACIALSALMLTGNACTDHDDLRTPAGTQLLALGEVTVAGTQTAATRTAAGTRAATEQDLSTGFTGIRKTLFVENDVLNLTLTAPNGSGGTTDTPVTATLGANGWTLTDRTYYTPGTKLTATYTPATQPGSEAAGTTGGIRYADVLTATTGTLPTDGSKLALTLTHANALIEVTPPGDVTDGTYTIALSATPAATSATPSPAAEELGIAREEGATTTDLRYRTIAPADATLSTISLKVNGMTYTTTLTQKVEANKRYPITLSITKDKLVATVGASDLNWGTPEGFDGRPGGYTRYIYTADHLAQFAADVNSGDAKATTATVLQMADIDLTGREWTPIGVAGTPFKGNYNGNGHTISNLTMTQTGNGSNHIRPGLFSTLVDAKVTGVHLRNCQITSSGVSINAAGALAGFVSGSIITLCSATGSISVDVSTNNAYATRVGGLIGWCADNNTVNHVNRCSADVAVSLNATSASAACGAFAGYAENTLFASCIASGKVTKAGTAGNFTGFTNSIDKGGCNIYYCITTSDVLQSGTPTVAFASNAIRVMSSIATQSYTNFATLATNHNIKNNVCLGSTTASLVGVSVGTSASEVYGKLTDVSNSTQTTTYEPVKTLHYSKEEGYTLDVVERKWYAKDIWQNNGSALPTLNMSYQGTPEAMYGTVYKVNGYYVTMADNGSTRPVWNADTSAATMNPDPCAAGAANGWRVPTMKDFEAMTGLSTTHPWHQGVANTYVAITSDYDSFTKAFPADNYYWSSTPNTNTGKTDSAWRFIIENDKRAQYSVESKSHPNNVRCVQKQ